MRSNSAFWGGPVLVSLAGSLASALLAGPATAAPTPEDIYVSNYGAMSVAVYPRTATGDVAPTRTIRSGVDHPHMMSVDLLHHELFVVNNLYASNLPAINVFDLDASFPGSDVPKRTLTGPNTGLNKPAGVLADPIHGELYVANDLDYGSSIRIYQLEADGNVGPIRTLEGGATGIEGPIGMAIDYVHDELIVVSYKVPDGGSISFFPRTASGNATPIRVIQGSHTGLSDPQGVGLDPVHDEIVVANSAFLHGTPGNILVFSRSDYGDASPLRQIGGPTTKLCNPVGIVVDTVDDEISVANSHFGSAICQESVTTYARTASGDAAPLRTIGPGPLSAFDHPTGVAITTLVDCSDPAVAEGTSCDDGNGCTQTDTCQAGVCVGADPVVCSPDGCHEAGTCDPATGVCSQPAKADGTVCNDGNACTQTDACLDGVCTGSNPVECAPADTCHEAGSCDPATGVCSASVPKSDGTACDDASACTVGETCQAGACVGGSPLSCDDADPCTLDTCDVVSGCAHAFQDADGDTVCDAQDCAPNDPGAFAVPGEVTALAFGADKVTLTWGSETAAAGPGTVSDLLRGSTAELPVGSGPAERCLESGLPAPSAVDGELPAPDSGWWYLVRGSNACGQGPYGFASDGAEEASAACP